MRLHRLANIFMIGGWLITSGQNLMVQNDVANLNVMEVGYFIDSTGHLTDDEVHHLGSEAFLHSKKTLNLGILTTPIWLKLKLQNRDPKESRYVFYINNSLLDTVALYQYNNAHLVASMQQGEHYPSYFRYYDTKNIVFPLRLHHDKTYDVYVKIKTSGAVYLPMMVTSQKNLFDHEKVKYIFYGLFYGAILVVLIYNFFLFFSLRDSIYFLYNTYIMVIVAAISMLNGCVSYLGIFDGHRDLLNSFFGILALLTHIFSCLFCYRFLEIYKKKSLSNVILKAFMALGVFFLMLSFFIPYKATGSIASILFIFTPFFIFYISVQSWVKGNKIARFYICASSVFLASVFITSLRVLGYVEGSVYHEFMLEIGVLIDAIFISMALADKLRKLNIAMMNAQEKERFAIAEKEMVIVEHNNILEEKIGQRAMEMLEKNHQIEFYAQKIAQQNQLLQQHNENLESQIDARTMEISLNNNHLAKKTTRLEQFTYIVSHNLKSPVQNIDILLNFIDQKSLDMPTREYFCVLRKTNDQLKNIISDINVLVSQDRGSDIVLNEIDLSTIINNIKEKLVIQILESNCLIYTDFEIQRFPSFSPYIDSILYNLVNNAIKYRSLERSIVITINAAVLDDQVVITVKDNGKGIEPDKLEHICKLFYRIDEEHEGRGMGLFIVKSQIEQLDGKLVIGSEVGLGTVFTILLPLKKTKADL